MLLTTILSELQEKFNIAVVQEGKKNYDIYGIAFLLGQDAQLRSDCLYVCSDSSINVAPECQAILTASSLSTVPDIWVLQIDAAELTACINAVSTILITAQERESEYEALMHLLIGRAPLHTIVNRTADFLQRSFIITDLSFKLLDYSDSVPITDPIWLKNIERGYCTYEFIDAVNKLMTPSANENEAFVVECWLSQEKRLCCPMKYNGQLIGYIAIVDNEKGLLPFHFQYLPKLCNLFVHILKQSPLFDELFTGIAESAFLDLLQQKNSNIARERLVTYNISLPKSMRCAVFQMGNPSVYDKRYLQSRLKSAFSTFYVFPFQDYIVAIFDASSFDSLSDAVKDLKAIRKIGVSSQFNDIGELDYQFSRALRACEISTKLGETSSFCVYDNYPFFDLLMSCPDEKLFDGLFHPSFEILHQYDLEKDSDLLRTLQTFILCGRHMSLSAQKLYIHRNSLRSRLDKIRELTGIDFDNEDVLFQLICSVKVNQLLKYY